MHQSEGIPDLSSFAAVTPGVVAAIAFAGACLVALVAGDWLPGGRWSVVHLFTLGVLSTLIWEFSSHLAMQFTNADGYAPSVHRRGATTVVWAMAIVTMLAGRASDTHLAVILGSLGIMAMVGINLLLLRRLRLRAPTVRFSWIVQQYERAHLAFLVAAALGGALGAGWVPAAHFTAVRDTHIQLNVLGWAGITVLATLTVLGPALLRGEIRADTERSAKTASGIAVLGLAMAAGGFMLTSISEGAGPPRVLAVLGLAFYAYASTAIVWPLLRTAYRSKRSPLRLPLLASMTWMLVAVGANAALIAVGRPGWPTALMTIVLVGALAQLMLAVLLHVAPTLRGRSLTSRARILGRVERFAPTRAVAYNLGVALVVGAQVVGRLSDQPSTAVTIAGWALVVVVVLLQLVVVAPPARRQAGK